MTQHKDNTKVLYAVQTNGELRIEGAGKAEKGL